MIVMPHSLPCKKFLQRAIFALSFFIAFAASGANAASRASYAISPLEGDDPAYFYADFQDAGEISRRLQKSQTLRFISAQAKDMLKGIPASEISLLFSVSGDEEPSFQMAWKLGKGRGEFLKGIAAGSASTDELEEFFGKIANLITVRAPEEGVPFYRLDPPGFYLSSDGELLVFANSIEGVKKSLRAAHNGYKRFSPKTKSGGRNLILCGLGKEYSSFFANEIAGILEFPAGALFPENIAVEMNVSPRPGGWELDIFTDAVRPLYGDGFFERGVRKPAGPFFKAGGGRLVAAVDGIVNADLVDGYDYIQLLSYYAGVKGEWDSRFLRQFAGDASEYVRSAMSSDGRLNFAITAAPDGKLAGYAAVLEGAPDWKRVGDALSKALAAGGTSADETAGTADVKEIPNDDWNHVFSIETREIESGSPVSVTAAFGDDRAFLGFMPPGGLEEPFDVNSELYESLTKNESALEIVYVDMKFLRRISAARQKSDPSANYGSKFTAMTMIPFLDIREAGAQTLSPEHFKFIFKTGWLDFEEREYVDTIM